ncbi:hypothetical protein J6590_073031 [Homalodisca vitripennis]|nr:hypothetical protein J6590_073031 [Homalodisca vitripennis]
MTKSSKTSSTRYMYESRDSVGKSCIFLQYEVLSDAARRGCGRVLTPTVPMDYGPPLGLGMQPVRATCIYLQPSNMSGYQMIYPGAGSLLADSRVARVDRPSSAQLASRLGMTLGLVHMSATCRATCAARHVARLKDNI